LHKFRTNNDKKAFKVIEQLTQANNFPNAGQVKLLSLVCFNFVPYPVIWRTGRDFDNFHAWNFRFKL